MARKTVDVEFVLNAVNEILKDSLCPPERRKGMINVLETILVETGNYKGFRYLGESEVPAYEKPGIWDVTENRFDDTDSTRVQYF